MKPTIEYDLNQIYSHFGFEEQWKKLIEETREFQETPNIEECADVFVVVVQLYLNNKEIQDTVDSKIKRTIVRILDEYYLPN